MSHASTSAMAAVVVDATTLERMNKSKQTAAQSRILRDNIFINGTSGDLRNLQHHRRRRRTDAVNETSITLQKTSSDNEDNDGTLSIKSTTKDASSVNASSMDVVVDSKAAKVLTEGGTAGVVGRIAKLQSKAVKKIIAVNSNKNDVTTSESIVDHDHGIDVKEEDHVNAIHADPEEREIFDGNTNNSLPQKCLKPKAAKSPPVAQPPPPPPPISSSSANDVVVSGEEDATTVIENRAIDPNTGEEGKEQHTVITKPTPPLPPPPKQPPLAKNATVVEQSNTTNNNTSRITTNGTESTLGSSNNTTYQDTAATATTAEIIEYENICDKYGNLLPGETSYAPTITPAIDENGQEEEDITDLPALADNDHDGLTNEKEILLGTDPSNSDSDTDGLDDGQEVSLGTDPLLTDTDMDGRNDYEEVLSPYYDVLDTIDTSDNDGDGLSNTVEESESSGFGTDPDLSDTDGDGLSDGVEVIIQGTDPIMSDTDGDSLSDYDETMIHGTNPLAKDSDGDGMSDGFEIEQGLDPLSSNANSNSSEVSGEISPGCEIWSKNEWGTIYTTSIPASVNFIYEVSVSDDVNMTSVVESMENNMARMVGGELIQCESTSTRNLLEQRQLRLRQRRHLLVDGIDRMPRDIVTEMACTYFTANNAKTPSNSSCYVIQGLMTLYLREDSALTSTLQSSSEALKYILDAMNMDDPSPFLEGSGDDGFSVSGVKGVRYIKGTPDEGGIVLIDNNGNEAIDEEGDDVDGAEEEDINSNEARSAGESLSTLGISLVAIGAAAVIGTIVAATVILKKRKRTATGTDSRYAEFFDDGNDLDMKHQSLDATTDMDASSMRDGSTPTSKRSRQLDWEADGAEEDSVFSGLDNVVAQDDNDPTFVHTPNNNDTDSVAMTTFEQGYEMAISPMFLEERSQARRYYEGSPIERPMYDNPVGIRKAPDSNGRDYYVGNIVEF